MYRRTLFSIACLLCLLPPCVAQDVQARAQSMLQRARQLSDIRSSGAPAFRLTATFSFVGNDLETVHGTYTETWISDSQWRRETVIGDRHYIDLAAPGKHWLVFPDAFPTQASKLPTLMSFLPPASLDLVFDSISERSNPYVTAECAFTKPTAQNAHFVLCFEKKSGVLLEKGFPEKRPRNLVNLNCEYGTFQKFGDYAFPREVDCLEDRHKSITANVVELTLEPPNDPALFDPPPGAIDLGHCAGKAVPPTLIGSGIVMPGLNLEEVAWLSVWFVVDEKGTPQNLRVLRSVDKHAHDNAWNAVRNWRFKPGTCDGKPMPMPLTVEIPFTPH